MGNSVAAQAIDWTSRVSKSADVCLDWPGQCQLISIELPCRPRWPAGLGGQLMSALVGKLKTDRGNIQLIFYCV